MNIQHTQNGDKGIFFIETDNEKLAEMTYLLSTGIMTIDHTLVNEKLRGKNIGYQLVRKGAEYAREKNLKIIPECPFARSVFEKKLDEFTDVWQKNK